ncbi:MAG: hypothetical protein NDJ90_04110 [Oligoflexia bacterium]|nr:hypothetical protein [Oligoflexia bacterium]
MGTDDLQSKAAELMKKVLTVGVGAIFLTEESLRALVAEFKLPKELLNGILDSAAKTKNEFLRTLSQDVLSRVVDKVEPSAMMQEFLNRNDLEFTVRLSVKPKKKKEPREREEAPPTPDQA